MRKKKKPKRRIDYFHLLICIAILGGCIFGVIKLKDFLFSKKNESNETVTEVNENTDNIKSSTPSPSLETEQVVATTDPREDKIQELMNQMTLEEKVGQLFIVRCPDSNEISVLQQYKLGGYILFASDFENETTESIQAKISSFQENSSIPMLIGVDEEGGTVTRISKYSQYGHSKFQSPQTLYNAGGLNTVVSDTRDKCTFLKNLGINVNFAPVADVSTNSDDFIYSRTLGTDASTTSEYIASVTKVMKEENIGSVLKHFPGYGNNSDTHTGIAYDNRSIDSFYNNDFKPFEAGIDEGANMILVSHNIVSCMDENTPASLSKNVHDILRNDLDFKGVIMTDDLIMKGITDYVDGASAAIIAIQAGNDLLCCTDYETQVPAVIQAVQNGQISEERINESLYRILSMKIDLGLITY